MNHIKEARRDVMKRSKLAHVEQRVRVGLIARKTPSIPARPSARQEKAQQVAPTGAQIFPEA